MTGRTCSTSAASLLAIVAAGCTINDPRTLEIVNLGPVPADTVLQVRVRAAADIDHVALDLDGRALGRFPTRNELSLDVSFLDEGLHTLTATAGGGRPPPPATLVFEVGRGPTATLPPALANVQPPAGGVAAPSPFQVVLTFSKRLDPAYVTPLRIHFQDSWGPLPTTVSLGSDGRTVVMALGLPLETAGAVSARAQVRDVGGRYASFTAGSWFAWQARVFFDAPTGDVVTNGTVTITPRAEAIDTSNSAIPGARLFAGDVLVATLGPPPWAPVIWDTRTVPEGRYPLALDVDGFKEVLDQAPPVVGVDRTGPTVMCWPQHGAPDQVWLRDTIDFRTNETVTGSAALLVNGVPYPAGGYYSGSFGWLKLFEPLPAPPFTLTVDLAGLRDLAGNPVAAASGCTFEVPYWLAPWGTGPITQGATPILAAEIGLDYAYDDGYPLWQATLSWIPPPGEGGEGSVFVTSSVSPDPWSSPALRSSPGTYASELAQAGSYLAWTQHSASQPGLVVFATVSDTTFFGPQPVVLNFDSRRDADRPTPSASQVAWSEVDEIGARVIRTKYWDPWGWHVVTGDVRADPSASADSPSLSSLLAFLESTPGGVPQVRAARELWTMEWESFPGSLNLDPTASAAQPAASVDLPWAVAWVESGRVLARIAGDPSVSLTFGPAAVLNVDATRPARSPRGAAGAVFFFAEQATDGDEIWARRWDGTEWRLLPGPVNAPASGPVRFIATSLPYSPVSPRPAVAWVDDGGAVRLRAANW